MKSWFFDILKLENSVKSLFSNSSNKFLIKFEFPFILSCLGIIKQNHMIHWSIHGYLCQ